VHHTESLQGEQNTGGRDQHAESGNDNAHALDGIS
jgi:hypothetical protein